MAEPAEDLYARIADAARLVQRGDDDAPDLVVWDDEHWVLVRAGTEPGSVLRLRPRDTRDLGTLDDELASQLGRISTRLVRIIGALDHVDGVHTLRVGDAGPRLDVWFVPQARGATAESWDADLHTVATKLANWGGEARA